MTPFTSLVRFIELLLTRRLSFPRERVGRVITLDGETWRIFRQVVVLPGPGRSTVPGARFIPRFHPAGMTPRANITFSLLMIPFFVGLPGFRSKFWLVQPETGDFAGLYEWDTPGDAENYSHSYAVRFMTRRSVPGSTSFRIESIN